MPSMPARTPALLRQDNDADAHGVLINSYDDERRADRPALGTGAREPLRVTYRSFESRKK